jgi:lysophospholipase L1-like esterase
MIFSRRNFLGASAAIASAAALGVGSAQAQPARSSRWIGTWGAACNYPIGEPLVGRTVRNVVRLSLGGSRIRVRLSNETGDTPVVIGAARIALAGPDGAPMPGSDRVLTFGGRPSVRIPAGAPALSDGLDMEVRSLTPLCISLFIREGGGLPVVHRLGVRRNLISAPGDFTAAPSFTGATESTMVFYLGGVEVEALGPTGCVVTLGDSITDGFASTVNGNRRWPDRLAERLAERGGTPWSVVNAGISGNRVLHDLPNLNFGPSALSRLDRDVLAVPGATHLVVLEGINDLGHSGAFNLPHQIVSVEDLIAGYGQILERARSRRLRVIGGTLTPCGGHPYATLENEEKRQRVNSWIRESGAYDGVIDFDAAARDPADPTRLRREFDSGDHLHPNDAGYAAMGNAIDLGLLPLQGSP